MAYIDEQKAKRKLQYIFRAYGVSNVIKDKIFKALSDSTADVQEAKHGKWKINTDEYDCEYMMCSVCKEEFYPVDEDTVDTTPNYCPYCGAKMDGGAE